MTTDVNAGWKRGDPIGYVRPEIPEFGVPGYEGDRYRALVPDTFDLQERAALAVNGLTSPTDPLADHEIYFKTVLKCNPPSMHHDWNDQCQIKFMEALPLMRIISGSALNSNVDRTWMEVTLHQLGPDGLAYLPFRGRPWAAKGLGGYVPSAEVAGVDQHINAMWCGRLLSSMMLYQRRDGGSLWREAGERLVDGLAQVAVDRGRYAYYSPSSLYVVRGSTVDHGPDEPLMCGFVVSQVILGLVHVYRETGYDPALTLARKLVTYLLEKVRYVDGEGRFVPGLPQRPGWAHIHAHTYSLLSILEYALTTSDEGLLQLSRKGYEYGRASGNALVGYFPEYTGSDWWKFSELCGVADMIALGLKLSAAGVGDYWDDVDRWARNMFAEGQLTRSRADWLGRYSAELPATAINPINVTTERVLERNIGAFAGWPMANEWWDGVGAGIMGCCTGNSTRAIYYLWEHMLTYSGGKVQVNLLLNRPSPWADVESHIPYVGQVDVKVKEPCDLSIRIPEWVQPREVRVQVNGEDRQVDWAGRYAVVGEVKPGDEAEMTFPIEERTDTAWIEKERFTLVRKGNDVVAIDPPGRICPLYQREHYRVSTARWRRMERFVSKEEIHW